MLVTHYFTIGNVSVSSSWIALIVAFVVAYSAVRVRYGKKYAEALSDAFFYLIIVWKLSIVITDVSSVIRSPLSLIYFDGGVVGFYLGLAFVAGKVLWDSKKERLTVEGVQALFTGAVAVQAVFQVMMVLLNEGQLVVQVVTVVAFALFALFYWIKGDGSLPFVWLFMAVHAFVAAWQPAGLVGTSFITTVLIGIIVMVVDRRNRCE
ncbi:hypothetical protein [Sporosarcina sp. YIM B06819]|uniref:hypothetical protein n=1 Tax=Sporosarcina sp. YIM B06819 TaxID=3081769 RepID=UPI00298CB21D|nr:hypothetical protein [Sporosarcina sp. YIM B06819]